MDVTKEQFDAVYDKYGPGKFLKFVYTYYNVKMKRKGHPLAWGTLLGVIGWGIGTIGLIVFDQLGMKEVAKDFLWAYVPFAAFIIALPAHLINNARTKKIAKELGISLQQYNDLVDYYYPES